MLQRPIFEEYDDYIYDYETSNISFLALAGTLMKKGRKNHSFFLKLYDEDLVGVDPWDEDLDDKTKLKIAFECSRNFFYFLREIMRIPAPGEPLRFNLHRGNLAAIWAYINNINSYLVLPRQHGKTWIALSYALWLFNFGGNGIKMIFMNKSLQDSKENLKRLKEARDLLPDYLQLKVGDNGKGKLIDYTDNVTTVTNAHGNQIDTKSSANNPTKADQLGRGLTLPWCWFDEFAFLLYNEIIWASAIPAWSKASEVAIENGIPSALLITTTPGDLSTPHGDYAHQIKELSGRFDESVYDLNPREVQEWLARNSRNDFVYIEFHYEQLGHADPQAWFEKQCKALQFNYPKIRREILLQWSNSTSNSPFNLDDLNALKYMKLMANDAWSLTINKYYKLNVYKQLNSSRKYIIGIDPSKMRGEQADNTAVVVVDAETQELCAIFKSNVMGYKELYRFIYSLVVYHLPNSVIVVENNIGDTIIEYLIESPLRHLVYYEFNEDKTKEKRTKGVVKRSQNDTIVYGIATTQQNRPKYFDILFEYVKDNKDLICCEEMVNEIECLEYKGSDRVDHASGKHDDVILAYLLTQYVMVHGNNKARFGLFNVNQLSTESSSYITNDKVDSSLFGVNKKRDQKQGVINNPFFQSMLVKFDTLEELEVKWQRSLMHNKSFDDLDDLLFDLFDGKDDIGMGRMSDDAFTALNSRSKNLGNIWDLNEDSSTPLEFIDDARSKWW